MRINDLATADWENSLREQQNLGGRGTGPAELEEGAPGHLPFVYSGVSTDTASFWTVIT